MLVGTQPPALPAVLNSKGYRALKAYAPCAANAISNIPNDRAREVNSATLCDTVKGDLLAGDQPVSAAAAEKQQRRKTAEESGGGFGDRLGDKIETNIVDETDFVTARIRADEGE